MIPGSFVILVSTCRMGQKSARSTGGRGKGEAKKERPEAGKAGEYTCMPLCTQTDCAVLRAQVQIDATDWTQILILFAL